jgi:uncharacterized protein with GYD domain
MPTYVSLASFTEQGVKEHAQTADRAEDTRQTARQLGGEVRHTYWTLGHYDVVLVADFPDDEAATAFALAISSRGFLRTTTMRAFDDDEIRGVIGKLG